MEKDKNDINHYFDIEDNIKDDNKDDFKKIIKIKSSLEVDLLSINSNFNILFKDFDDI